MNDESMETPFHNEPPPDVINFSISVDLINGKVSIGTDETSDPISIVNGLLITLHFMMPILARFREEKLDIIKKEVSNSILEKK